MNFSNFEKEINNTILKRGKDYYKWGTVENIKYSDFNNTFSANVLGSSDYYYDTEVQIQDNEITGYNCSCPYEGVCKHVVALLYEIRENYELNELAQGENNNTIARDSSFYKRLETVTEQYMVSSTDFDNFYRTLNEYIETLKLSSSEIIKLIKNYFNFGERNHANMENYHYLVYELFCKLKNVFSNADLEVLINQYISTAYTLTNYRNTIIDKIISQISDKEIKYLYYKALINNEKLGYINRISVTDIKDVVSILKSNAEINGDYLIPFLNMNDDIRNQIINYFRSNISDNEKYVASYNFWTNPDYHYYNILKEMLTFDEILKVAEKINYRNLSFNNFVFLTKELKIDVNINVLNFTYEDINDNLDSLDNNLKEKVINKLKNDIINDNFKRKITIDEMLVLIDKLGGSFENILSIKNELIFRLYDLKIYSDENTLYLKNQGLPSQLKKVFGINKEMSKNANEYKILIIEDENTFKTKLLVEYLNLLKIPEVVSFDIEDEELILNENNMYNLNEIKGYLSNSLSSDKQAEYDQIVDRLYEKRFEELEKKTKYEAPLLIQKLSNELTNYELPLLNEDVKIYPILVFDFKDVSNKRKIASDGYKAVGAKVGFNKDYIVKNLAMFLSLVEENGFYSYGKGLAFHHDIKQFDNKSQRIISTLEKNIGVTKYRNNDFLVMSDSKVDEVIDICKGSYLYLVNEYNVVFSNIYVLYKVIEEEYMVDISLEDEGFKLNLSDSIGNKNILELKSSDYIVDLDNKTIQKVCYINQKQRNITKFILDNPRINVEYAIDDFINKIIPFIDQEIKFSDSLKEKVVNKTIRIDSYLDYDTKKDVIALKRKYYDNNIEVLKPNTEFQKVIIDKYNQTLEMFGFEKDVIKNQELIIHFITANLDSLKKFGELYISETLKSMQIKKMEKAKISITLNSGLLKTHIEQKEFNEEELRKILKAYEKKKKYIYLNGNAILIDTKEVEDLRDYVVNQGIDIDNFTTTRLHPIHNLFKLYEQTNYLDVEVESKIEEIIENIKNYKNNDYTSSLSGLLKPYQLEGFKWLKTLYDNNLGGILADDMGLGKTIQMISLFDSIKTDKPLLVVCPKSLVYNWENELDKFKIEIEKIVYVGSKKEREDIIKYIKDYQNKLIVISSYDTLRNDIDEFRDIKFDTIVLDEAQNIKSIDALRTIAAKSIDAEKRFVLTGTPIENGISDLWSIFDFLMPGYLYTYQRFKKIEERATTSDEKAMDFIIKKTAPFILRRTKKTVLKELPPKIEEVIYGKFDNESRKAYDSYLLKVKERMENPDTNKMEILADITKLRQLAISPKLLYNDYESDSEKIELLTNLIDNSIESGHKVLVFSSFVKALDLVKEKYNEDLYFELTGKTEARSRIDMVNEFNKQESAKKVFFISLKAGGTGLNLVGADIVIHIDPWWNDAAEQQANDRTHRIGQKNSVTIYKVIMKESIEEKILELQAMKKELFEQIVEEGDSRISKMSINDYKYLLE